MWDSILNGVGWLLYKLAMLVGDWGVAIIIVTLVIRLLLFPLQRKQLKSSWAMKELQPKMNRIKEVYAGDQQKIQEETQKLYTEAKFNPLSGCLPLLIQMPIFVIIFQVLRRKLTDYSDVTFFNIIPDLTTKVSEAWQQGIGIAAPYIVLFIFFVLCSLSPLILQMRDSSGTDQASQSRIMMIMMGLMFVYMGVISPAGVLIYWAISSLFGFLQQIITNKSLEKQKALQKEQEVVVEPVYVNVQRKEKKKRQHKSH